METQCQTKERIITSPDGDFFLHSSWFDRFAKCDCCVRTALSVHKGNSKFPLMCFEHTVLSFTYKDHVLQIRHAELKLDPKMGGDGVVGLGL